MLDRRGVVVNLGQLEKMQFYILNKRDTAPIFP